MSDQPTGQPRARGVAMSWQRALWIGVAALVALTGLWDSRSLLLGDQSEARAVALPAPITVAATPDTGAIVRRNAREVTAGNGLAVVSLDLARGRLTLRWPATALGPATTLNGANADLLLRGIAGSGPGGALFASDYAHHRVETAAFGDALGSGLLITFNHDDPRYPPFSQQIRLYRDSAAVVLSATVGAGGGPLLEVSRFEPLVTDSGAGTLSLPGNSNPLVLAINGLTADHMPRQFVPLAALPAEAPLPYVTTIDGSAGTGAFLAGALRATSWFPGVKLWHGAGGISSLALTNAGPVGGKMIASEPFMLGAYADGETALRAYALAAARLTPPPIGPSSASVQLGWSSWGAFAQAINQVRVERNADFMASHLRGLGYTTIHIDDGWQKTYGDWQPDRGFPAGMRALARYIHAHGLLASIWLAPFLTAPNAWPAHRHPDWLLRNMDGSPVQITVTGPTYVLDVSNPAVLAYIQAVCARIRDWGFDSVKLDFLYTGALEGQRYRFDLNGMQAYNAAMRVVRDTLEANPRHPIYLLGVQQGFLPGGYFRGWRVGRDIESKTNADHVPTWDLIRREALAVSTFAFANGVLYGTDPDDLLLRRVRGAHNLSADELQSYATMVALGGSVWLSGDDLPGLAAQGRLGYLTNLEVLAVVRAGRAGLPVDLADQGAGPASIWNVPQANGGTVAGLFNWTNGPRRITVRLADLGLTAGRAYRVRDLWARADQGRATGSVTVNLRPHQSVLVRLTPG